MRAILGAVLGAILIVSMPGAAAAQAQPAAAVQSDDPAKLAEARGIINVMFPPASREQIIDKMITDLTATFRQSLPADDIKDPGLKAIFQDYRDGMLTTMRPVMIRHLPEMTEAMAVAYAHQFTLAQLKDIHAFALTPSGSDYFSHVLSVVGDPAVRQANVDMVADAQQAAKTSATEFKDKLTDYLKAHPNAESQLANLGKAPTQGK